MTESGIDVHPGLLERAARGVRIGARDEKESPGLIRCATSLIRLDVVILQDVTERAELFE